PTLFRSEAEYRGNAERARAPELSQREPEVSDCRLNHVFHRRLAERLSVDVHALIAYVRVAAEAQLRLDGRLRPRHAASHIFIDPCLQVKRELVVEVRFGAATQEADIAMKIHRLTLAPTPGPAGW